jgi:cyclopropane-fatty-acyl-phospholipid synthase
MDEIEYGQMVIETPRGLKHQFKGNKEGLNVFIKVNDWKFCEKLFLAGDIGLGESYIKGYWECDNINDLIHFGIQNKHSLERVIKGSILKILFYRVKHLFNRNTKSGSERNIHAHYDLGNSFYKLWLDPSMTYSSALFEDGMTLQEAQINKYKSIFDKLHIKSGQEILEVGCGWGGFMEYAASRGVKVTGVTISREQFDYATQRLEGYPQTKVLYCDYRDIQGKFDHIVSIEMFEALGREYWSTYFKKLASLLKLDGKIVIQSITMNNDDFKSYAKGTDFIQQYIFPGGLLAGPSEFRKVAKKCHLLVESEFSFGLDYAKTLDIWNQSFESVLEKVKELGFDKEFIRTWHFYLKYCQGGFEAGKIGVSHYVLKGQL